MNRNKKLADEYSDCLTDKEIAHLCDLEPINSHFYGLPKIHKNSQIQTTVSKQNNFQNLWDNRD